ncbi:MAG: potassium channel family protein [Planctomycetota bacterium]
MTSADRSRPLNAIGNFVRAGFHGRHYEVLLISLVLYVIVQPLFITYGHIVTLAIFLSLLLLAGLLVASQTRTTVVVGLILGLPFFATIWLHVLDPSAPSTLASHASAVVFCSFLLVTMLRDVVGTGRVSRQTLYGAACAYLLVAVTFSFVYAIVEYLNPDAFTTSTSVVRYPNGQVANIELLYFSLVTLTTLGYGDITPVGPTARAIAAVEAVVGVLYTALLVARLVGMYAAAERAGRQDAED